MGEHLLVAEEVLMTLEAAELRHRGGAEEHRGQEEAEAVWEVVREVLEGVQGVVKLYDR